MEEALADTFVDDDQCHLWWVVLAFFTVEEAVLLLNDLVQLLKLKINDLLTHGIADTVTVDENVVWHFTRVKFTVALEGSHEVVRQNGGGDNFLTFLGLRRSLCIVLAHVTVVGGAEANS